MQPITGITPLPWEYAGGNSIKIGKGYADFFTPNPYADAAYMVRAANSIPEWERAMQRAMVALDDAMGSRDHDNIQHKMRKAYDALFTALFTE